MRIRTGLWTGLQLLAIACLVGCSDQPPVAPGDQEAQANAASVRSFMDAAAANAALAERAVYPQDFVPHGAAINELGEARLQALAEPMKAAPGEVVLVQGDAPPELQRARVKAVLDWLAAAGVDSTRVTVSDQLPGGRGASSSQAVKALEGAPRQSRATGSSQGYTQNNSGNR